MNFKYLIFFFLSCAYIFGNSFEISNHSERLDIPIIVLPYIDNQEKLLYDKSNNQPGPTRFAERINVSYNISNSGKWF